MSDKVYIEIDASPWMDADGVDTCVFIGDGCAPVYSSKVSYEELVDKELEAHTVRGRLTGHNIDEAEKFVVALEEAAVRARALFEDLQDVED